MTYEKPEIAPLGPAVEMIQGQKGLGEVDSAPHQQRPSIAAYEADE
jgi:hypothetical protein